jgi:ParB-like chromosome segregation protein Spo0J
MGDIGTTGTAAGLVIERLALDALVPYARNARTHSEAQVAQIAASICEFGFCNPVLIDAAGGIIAGHGRVLAARQLGLGEVPCIRLGHLTEVQRRAYVIADNKLALNAGWDEDLLAMELSALRIEDFDLGLTGFDPGDVGTLLNGPDFGPATAEEQGRLDQLAPKIVTCPHCGEEFDIRG